MTFSRRPKPRSARQQERDAAELRRAEDSMTPPDGWPAHYSVRVTGMGWQAKAVHCCAHCGARSETSLRRGMAASMSRSFAKLHKDCTKPKGDDASPQELP